MSRHWGNKNWIICSGERYSRLWFCCKAWVYKMFYENKQITSKFKIARTLSPWIINGEVSREFRTHLRVYESQFEYEYREEEYPEPQSTKIADAFSPVKGSENWKYWARIGPPRNINNRASSKRGEKKKEDTRSKNNRRESPSLCRRPTLAILSATTSQWRSLGCRHVASPEFVRKLGRRILARDKVVKTTSQAQWSFPGWMLNTVKREIYFWSGKMRTK